MEDNRSKPTERGNREQNNGNVWRSSRPNDLPDSASDKEKLQPEETYIDLPDVKDIPGQEFVNAPPAGMLADTTISSDDEEGRGIFDEEGTEDFRKTGNDSDVNIQERAILGQVDYLPTRDEENLQRASMDSSDFEGDQLNEKEFGRDRTGVDLDIPGSELDDNNENIGEEDEENNDYSLGSSENDLNEARPN